MALVSGSLDSTLKESNGNTFYNVRLNGKSIELLSGKYPTFITKPRSDQDRPKAHSRIKEAISAPVDEVKTDAAKEMTAENETGHIVTNNSKYIYHTKSVVQSRKRLKTRYKAKMLSERLIRFQEEGKNNK